MTSRHLTSVVALALVCSCDPKTSFRDGVKAGCQLGTECGKSEGEADGAACDYDSINRWECAVVDQARVTCKTDVEPEDNCETGFIRNYDTCWNLAYDAAYTTAAEAAGCPRDSGDSG